MNRAAYIIADVFTNRRFGGNQLAVFTDARGLSSETMQDLAREMNSSETTFILPPNSGGDFHVRIFTPERELPFAGHPIVGTAHVLVTEGLKEATPTLTTLRLETGVGILQVEVESADGKAGRTTMSQPPPEVRETVADVEKLAAILGLKREEVGPNGLPVEAIYNGVTTVIVPVASLDAVRRLQVDLGQLKRFSIERDAETVLIFTRETLAETSAAHCRVYAPGAGVFEDAATGSANGPLGFYLARHGLIELQPLTRIVSEQGFEMHRPSLLNIELTVEGGEVRAVRVGGDVVIAGRGEIYLD